MIIAKVAGTLPSLPPAQSLFLPGGLWPFVALRRATSTFGSMEGWSERKRRSQGSGFTTRTACVVGKLCVDFAGDRLGDVVKLILVVLELFGRHRGCSPEGRCQSWTQLSKSQPTAVTSKSEMARRREGPGEQCIRGKGCQRKESAGSRPPPHLAPTTVDER